MNSEHRTVHRLFIVGIILKGLNALLEIGAGIILVFTGAITGIFEFVTRSEFSTAHSELFAAWFLFIHGIIKGLVVLGLFSRKVWAYKVAEIVLFLFIIYELYEYTRTGSFWLIIFPLFDTALLWLTWREHKQLKVRYTENTSHLHDE